MQPEWPQHFVTVPLGGIDSNQKSKEAKKRTTSTQTESGENQKTFHHSLRRSIFTIFV